MIAMIFAAGLGTRLRPITDTLPKALVQLGGHTLLEYQLRKLAAAGIEDVIVNVHHFPDMIIDYLHQNQGFGCRVHISDERDNLLDTGGGLRKALHDHKDMIGEDPILALNVDILSNIHLPSVLEAYEQYRNHSSALLVVSERTTQRYLCFENNQLIGWTNLSTGAIRPNGIDAQRINQSRHLAFSGMQILSPALYPCLDSMPEEKFSLIDFYLSVCQKKVLRPYVPKDYQMMDVGKFDLLSDAEAFAQRFVLGE